MLHKVKKSEKEFIEDELGNTKLVAERQYDDEEMLIWEQVLYPSGEIQSEYEYEYENGLLIREKIWNEFGEWTEIKYFYKENGELAYRKSINSDGDVETKKKISSEFEDVIEYYDSDDILFQKQESFYNHNGKDVRRVFYEYGEVIEEHTYEYNSIGEMSKKISKFRNELNELQTSIFIFEYDADKNLILEIEQDENGNILHHKKSIYDHDGDVIKEIENDFPGGLEIIIHEYHYDDRKRLIKLTTGNAYGKYTFQKMHVYNQDDSEMRTVLLTQSDNFYSLPKKELALTKIEYY